MKSLEDVLNESLPASNEVEIATPVAPVRPVRRSGALAGTLAATVRDVTDLPSKLKQAHKQAPSKLTAWAEAFKQAPSKLDFVQASSKQARGGLARADALSPARRKEISAAAAKRSAEVRKQP